MKMTHACLFLGMFLFSLPGFGACGSYSEVPMDGGLEDRSNPQAPKVIHSNTITKFSLHFAEDGNIGVPASEPKDSQPPFPAGRYTLSAERHGAQAHFLLVCDRYGTVTPLRFAKDLPASALDELQAIIQKHKLAAINGSSLRNSALGTALSFHVDYDTDETLSVYAEGGASTLPPGWCGTTVFLEFFTAKLDAGNRLIPPLRSCSYALSNSKGLVYCLELNSEPYQDSKRAIFKETRPTQNAGQPDSEQTTKTIYVPREKLEALEEIAAKYQLWQWKDLPNREDVEDNRDFISIVFNYSGGGNICLNSDQHLPPEYEEAFAELRRTLTVTEAGQNQ